MVKAFIAPHRSKFALLAALAIYSVWYLAGVAEVPFHPDESTYLFMSDELSRVLQDPSAVFWQPEPADPQRQAYRLLNPPVIQDLLALGRSLVGLPALPADWRWSASWQENVAAGALPSPELLLAGRMVVAALTPLSLLLMYLCGRQLAGEFCGWAAAGLLAFNALVLLHTRRAMAEGTLLFTLLLCLWLLAWPPSRRPARAGFALLCGAAAALAFCAKHSLLALAPVGLLAVMWGPGKLLAGQRIRAGLAFGLGFAALFLLLNPVAWNAPGQVTLAMLRARTRLASQQVQNDPAQAIDSTGERVTSALAHVFFVPPRIAEVANYLAETQAQETAYFANPLHTLLRSLAGGAFFLTLTLFGFMTGCLELYRQRSAPPLPLLLWLTASVLQAVLLLVSVPLAWQRYYLALVVFACLWCAYGLARVVSTRSQRRV